MSVCYSRREKTFLFLFFLLFPPNLYLVAEDSVPPFCRPPWDLTKIANCIVENHPVYKTELLRLKEIQGRKKISSYYFPANPNISTYSSHRRASGPNEIFSTTAQQAANFQVMVTQEIYTGGKREKAIQIADDEFKSQVFRMESVRRNLSFSSLQTLIRYLNLKKEEEITKNLYLLSKDLSYLAKARVREGISPAMDESLSAAEELRMAKVWQSSVRRLEETKGTLYLLLSIPLESKLEWNPEIHIAPDLPNDRDSVIQLALLQRPEIPLSEREILLAIHRWEEVRLQKIPNLNFGAFVQNDGFNERVVGGQVSLPLTIWRDYEGESAVAKAKEEQARESKETVTRIVKQEVINALSGYLTLKEEFSLYNTDLLNRTDEDLNFLREALKTGKVKVIDAINSQRVLVQTKLNYIQTKTDYESAQMELIRALGLPLENLNLIENL
ncbi:hypothetical protein LPTSP3_g03230 [Leptospira kobayashii]|uniref:Outer membrane efflux protein n=1 Tax=Leptospira kobayashii TaxID=1917830 RepID=A0ABN6K9A0_9LEPT|nr:TolC family protein [Leptospira kobayashii]BDA77393.1 hypothetical protein LPTSP3_g03230 [Leptospira kobayashii]